MNKKIGPALILLAALVPAAIAAYWYLYLPGSATPDSLAEAPAPEIEAVDWEELRTRHEELQAEELRTHGLRYFHEGDPDKAFLMFKTAAKKGDGWAALAVGEMYDPNTFAAKDFTPRRTAFTKPNPRKALEWYTLAIEQGEPKAAPLRERLIAHLSEAARVGDSEARRVLQKVKP